jgi:hypothetical protein
LAGGGQSVKVSLFSDVNCCCSVAQPVALRGSLTHRYCGVSAESQQRQLLPGNDCAKTPVGRQWLSDRHVISARMKELLCRG